MKQVIVVNEALRLPRGKLAAQVAHAAVSAFLVAPAKSQRAWLASGMPKIVVRVTSFEEISDLEGKARTAGLPVAPIHDAGRTVVAEGTYTCLGIGPADEELLAPLTRALKLV